MFIILKYSRFCLCCTDSIASTRKLHPLMRWPGRRWIIPTGRWMSTAPTARPARTDLLTGRRRPSIALWRRRVILPRWVVVRFRVASHIHIGVHPLLITFFAVGGEEDADGWLVVARVVVVQAAEGVAVLAGEAFARCHARKAARVVAQVAVGAVGLVAAEGGAACCGTEGGDHAAEWVGQQDVGRRRTQARQFPDQTTVEAVVIRVVLQGAVGAVAVFFQAKGVDGDGRSATADGAAQRARAAGVVGVVFVVVRVDSVFDQPIQRIVGQAVGGSPRGDAGDVAPAVVAAVLVDGSAFA